MPGTSSARNRCCCAGSTPRRCWTRSRASACRPCPACPRCTCTCSTIPTPIASTPRRCARGARARALRNGWLHTGDVGRLDADGFLHVVERKKDLIIRGGFNVYPREVEDVLYAHPAVAEAAVVGVRDALMGEEVCAFVALKRGAAADAAAIIGFCQARLAKDKFTREGRFL